MVNRSGVQLIQIGSQGGLERRGSSQIAGFHMRLAVQFRVKTVHVTDALMNYIQQLYKILELQIIQGVPK